MRVSGGLEAVCLHSGALAVLPVPHLLGSVAAHTVLLQDRRGEVKGADVWELIEPVRPLCRAGAPGAALR